MQVAILTVGDEVLAGDIANTNAQWLASRITGGGSRVARILTVPDDRALIADTVSEWSAAFDAVILTGGLGGTHDDVTADALADAFGRELEVSPAVRRDVIETAAAYREANPERVEAYDLEIDVDAWAALPAGCRPLINPEGLCPGCVLENVYAFPGVPGEMRALYDLVAVEFAGEAVTRTLYTPQPEGSMVEAVSEVRERFDVTVGSYPSTETENRVKLTGENEETVEEAARWLSNRIEVVRRE
ncbi:competence/damage-inducible protein A [Natronorarus salvus]|uniref:competence/damage-inducible protein A n=1 Tax=Natronorarus salvus TaxID=3117733 RepID=UPI002F26C15A